MQLYPDQQDMIGELRAAFQQFKNVLLVSPTGSGKTVCFSYLANSIAKRGKSVYILVHREELMDQVSASLTSFGVEHGFVASGRPSTYKPVMVCSVFTLVNRMQDYPLPDMLILDEAHHASQGSTWSRILAHFATCYVLGVTATPIRLDGKPLRGHFAHMVLGLSVADLIARERLSDYVLYCPPIAIAKMRMRMGDFNREDMKNAMDKPSITGNAVDHYLKRGAGKRAVAFCVSLDHAAAVALEFEARGVKAARIDGGMDRKERKGLIAAFSRGDIKVLTSCDLISEGFDIPAIEVAILLRPTASLSLYLQQVGRALRRHPGKTHAIILDHAGNAGRHGYPDEVHEWSLGEEATGKAKKKAGEMSVRTCGGCYAAARSGTMICPYCKWEWPIEAREVQAEEGELEEVALAERQAAIKKRQEQGMAKTLPELMTLAKERGYKPGWAWKIFNRRHA